MRGLLYARSPDGRRLELELRDPPVLRELESALRAHRSPWKPNLELQPFGLVVVGSNGERFETRFSAEGLGRHGDTPRVLRAIVERALDGDYTGWSEVEQGQAGRN